MAKFKVGDRVRLVAPLPFDKAGRLIQATEKGVVIEVNEDTYTIEFEDSMMPISGVTEREIQPD
jgi:hypothetical protein